MPTPARFLRNALSLDHYHRFFAVFIAFAIAAGALALSPLTKGAAASSPRTTASALAKYESNMLKVLNAERRVHGLRPVKRNAKLVLSAHRHNLTMARANTLSHQLRGEAFFGDRISRAGYRWRAAAENIAVNPDVSNHGVMTVQKGMYKEHAPSNGHRLNILDRRFKSVGIDVYYDRGTREIWFTQDFGQPAG